MRTAPRKMLMSASVEDPSSCSTSTAVCPSKSSRQWMRSPFFARYVPGASSPFIPCPSPKGLGPADSGRSLHGACGLAVRMSDLQGGRSVVAVRGGPAHERFEGHAASRCPVLPIIGPGPVAIRPAAVVDGQSAVAVAGPQRAVLGRLTFPVDDAPRHHTRLPQLPLGLRSRL